MKRPNWSKPRCFPYMGKLKNGAVEIPVPKENAVPTGSPQRPDPDDKPYLDRTLACDLVFGRGFLTLRFALLCEKCVDDLAGHNSLTGSIHVDSIPRIGFEYGLQRMVDVDDLPARFFRNGRE